MVSEHRSKGIGSALIDEVFSYARSVGAERVQLSVWSFNLVARRFFTSNGFAPMIERLAAVVE